MFERAINGKDIATGNIEVEVDYISVGTKESTYREGNATVQFAVLAANATYNYTTGAPNIIGMKRRGVGTLSHVGKGFKP